MSADGGSDPSSLLPLENRFGRVGEEQFDPRRIRLHPARTGRQSGGAVAPWGLPAASNTWSWCAASKMAWPGAPVGHQAKCPRDRRLYLVSQNILSDGVTGLIDRNQRVLRAANGMFFPIYFRALGVTSLGFR